MAPRRIGAVVVLGVAVFALIQGVADLVDAVRGTTGDTAPSVPISFGVLALLLAAGAGVAAARLWRRRP
jgi:hypothetical protein